MRIALGTAAALILSVPVSAFAADLPVKARPVPPPAVVYNWNGFYIGGNIGYSFGRDPFEIAGVSSIRTRQFRAFGTPAETLISDATAAGPAFIGTGTADINGFVGGGQIGYNWQSAQWVFGLETDLQWTGQRGSISFCLTAGCPAGGFVTNADYKLQWFGTARARAGWLIDPRVLLYVTGGAAYGQFKADYTSGLLGTPLLAASTSTTNLGWTVGGGIEGMLSSNWTVKAEYLYVDLGSASSGTLAGGTTTTILANTPQQGFTTVIDTTVAGAARTRLRDNIVRVGVNYHFSPY